MRILALACLVALGACDAQRSIYEMPPPSGPIPDAAIAPGSGLPMGDVSDPATSSSTSNATAGSTATQRSSAPR